MNHNVSLSFVGGYQRANPSTPAILLLHGQQSFLRRRLEFLRQGGRAVLHPDQDHHAAVEGVVSPARFSLHAHLAEVKSPELAHVCGNKPRH
uniref:Uncharacterized protein n=1 Tax=Aegilops tauschii subsp. strangulata TaxID=200361 RepID=A0A453D1C1_AEGTS